jgi:ERCC4-type nuclease
MAHEIEPVVLIDTREQAPLPIAAYPTERATLPAGDYGVKGFSDWSRPAFICERKSLADLVKSLTQDRARFLKEVEKLRQFEFRALLIEAVRDEIEMKAYRGNATPASLLASVDALAVRYGLHLFWCVDAAGAARRLESLVKQFVGGVVKDYKRLMAAAVEAANA